MATRTRYKTHPNSNRPTLLRQIRAEIFKNRLQTYMRDDVAEIDLIFMELNRTPFINQPEPYRWYIDTLIEDLMVRMMPRPENQ